MRNLNIKNYIGPVYGIFCFLFLVSTEIFFIPLIFIFVNYPQTEDLWASDFIADNLILGITSAPPV